MESLVSWARRNASTLSTLDPDCSDTSDLQPLLDLVGNARVVALGESSHLVRESYLIKDRIFRFLVQEMGFSAWVMESGLPEGVLIDGWVRGAPGDVTHVAQTGATYFMGSCREFEAQLGWMRRFNAKAQSPVRFYGMDLPAASASHVTAVHTALDFLDTVDPRYADALRDRLLPLLAFVPAPDRLTFQSEALAAYSSLPAAHRSELTACIIELCARLGAMKLVYGERSRPDCADVAYRAAVAARQVDAFLMGVVETNAVSAADYDSANLRDAAMAENVKWILEREQRIVIGAHNGHLQRTPLMTPTNTTLGQHLAAAMGDDYRAIGSVQGSGRVLHYPDTSAGVTEMRLQETRPPGPNTIEHFLREVELPRFLLNLRQLPTSGDVARRLAAVGAMFVNENETPTDVLRAFDALIYVDRVDFYDTTRSDLAELVGAQRADA